MRRPASSLLPAGAMALVAFASSLAYAQGSTPSPRVEGTFGPAAESRHFVLFRPDASLAPRSGARTLLVMLHGCTQDASDVSRGTRLDSAAARRGMLVLYPEQPARAHPKKCWNWYLPADVQRGSGELAQLAALVDSVRVAEGGAPRILLAGMSAGAAMAANFAAAYPERVAALALHSGIAALAATDVTSALQVMREGPTGGPTLGDRVAASMGDRAHVIPVIALHGDADVVVSPANLEAVAQQWASANARVRGEAVPVPVAVARRGATGRRWASADGSVSVEAWRLEGVGHAWSGGSAAGTFTAPEGPDATAMILEFFGRAEAGR